MRSNDPDNDTMPKTVLAGPDAPARSKGTFTRMQWICLLLILLGGAVLRIAYLQELVKQPDFDRPIDDMMYHDYWARALVTGDWTPPPGQVDPRIYASSYQKPPAYPLLLALLYWLTDTNYVAVRVVQMALGLASAILAALLARRLFGQASGIITAALMASYWAFIYFEGELLTPVLEIFTFLLLVWVLSGWVNRATLARAVAAGVCVGIAMQVRPNLLFAVPVVPVWAAWVLWKRQTPRRIVPATAFFMLGFAAALAPATVRNYRVSGEFVPGACSNGGYNLYVANNPDASPVAPVSSLLEDLDGTGRMTMFSFTSFPDRLREKLGTQSMTFAEGSRYFQEKAIEYIKANPRKTCRMILEKAYLFWCPKEIDCNKVLSYDKQESRVLRCLPGFAPMLALGVLGLLLLAWDFRQERKRGIWTFRTRATFETAVLIALLVGVYYGSFLPFMVNSRYRVTVVPFVLLFAAFGLARLGQLAASRRWGGAALWMAAAGALYAVCGTQFIPYDPNGFRWHMNRSEMWTAKGDPDRALEECRAALKIADNALVRGAIGARLLDEGMLDEAIENFAAALRHDPYDKFADYNWARALMLQAKPREAEAHFREAIRKNPRYAESYNGLGAALSEQHRSEEAVAAFSQALETDPGATAAHRNLGAALIDLGRYDEAVEHLRRAVALNPHYARAYFTLAEALAGQNQFAAAIEAFDQGAALAPADALAALGLGRRLEEKGKPDQALGVYRAAFARAPANVEARMNAAKLCVSSGAIEEALGLYQEVIRLDPRNHDAYFNLGVLSEALHRAGDAERYYRKVLEVAPDDQAARQRLAALLAAPGSEPPEPRADSPPPR